MSKRITCGVFITDGVKFVVCHPTGSRWQKAWSIPKGMIDEGETTKDAAIREVLEETGLKVPKSKLKFEYKDRYTKRKDICVYTYLVKTLPNANDLKCTSFFTHGDMEIPEVDKFAIVDIEKYEMYLNRRQKDIFKIYLKKYNFI